MTITPEKIRSTLDAEGYCFPLPVFTGGDAARYRAELERCEVLHGGPLGHVQRHKPHLLFRWAAELAQAPKLLDLIEGLLGPDILVWDAVLFTKEPRGPEHLTWHQDLAYWGLAHEDAVFTAWIALSPSTRLSGCMRVIPGTHRRAIQPHRDSYAAHNLLSRGQSVVMDFDEGSAVDIELAPGEVSLHDGTIVHGSEPNRSDDRRLGFGIRYIPTATRQLSALPDSASLVRGIDRFGHFELEPPPASDFDPASVARHEQFRQRRAALQAAV